jgi:hypothetical protein
MQKHSDLISKRATILFVSLYFSASVFLPSLWQRYADGSGRKMIGKNMGIENLAEKDVTSSYFCPFIFLPVFLFQSLRQRHADDDYGRNMGTWNLTGVSCSEIGVSRRLLHS